MIITHENQYSQPLRPCVSLCGSAPAVGGTRPSTVAPCQDPELMLAARKRTIWAPGVVTFFGSLEEGEEGGISCFAAMLFSEFAGFRFFCRLGSSIFVRVLNLSL